MEIIVPFHSPSKLKRELGLLGSFSMGFADVGADIFLALGLIAAYAHGLMPLAILIAAFVYVTSGLSYAELAAAIPVSGGSSAYGKRAFGPFAGFLAGWGLLLDYTIDISLFAVASAGYLSFFLPNLALIPIGIPIAAALLIAILLVVNLLGIRESSAINSALTLVVILVLIAIVGLGFTFSYSADRFLEGLTPISEDPGFDSFLYSITLAIVAFVGIESISQGAEETRNPEKVIPRATFLAIFFVVLFAMLLSIMALGIVNWQVLADNMENPLLPIAKALPFASIIVPIVALAGFLVCFVSANTGIIGVSRVAYSMSNVGLMARRINWIHPKYRTPWITIAVFSVIAMALALSGDMIFLGELYAFGALTAYTVTNFSLLKLRVSEPYLHRPFKVPFNIKWQGHDIPITTIIGALGCLGMFALVALLHVEGRNFAAIWFIFGICYFFGYRHYRRQKDIEDVLAGRHPENKVPEG
ncbi:MAG: APC family permease [Candidatus Micrarchaeia archaeon]|jgi:APA family basic amino acid/polyamine antiporter